MRAQWSGIRITAAKRRRLGVQFDLGMQQTSGSELDVPILPQHSATEGQLKARPAR
jgi:hypothetical protein